MTYKSTINTLIQQENRFNPVERGLGFVVLILKHAHNFT